MIARPMSAMTRIRFREKRSTHTPAGSVNSRNGRKSTVTSRPTSPGDAPRTTAAMNGIAIWVTWVPNSETVAAVQRRAKSGLRKRERRRGAAASLTADLVEAGRGVSWGR